MSSSNPSLLRPSGRIPYHPALDGLRGIVLFVMLVYHGESSWIGGGYLSVSTFFTLSGFLITSLLVVERASSGHIDLRNFWVRRLRRLMPAALAGVALVAVYAALFATPSQLSRLRWDAAAALLYCANFRFMASGHSYWEIFSRPSPLQHYWSLSIEEQFYFVYPLLLIGLTTVARRSLATVRRVLLVLAAASTLTMIALSMAGATPARLYYGTDTRASEFLVGALLATLLVHNGQLVPWRGRGYRAATLAATAYVGAVVVLVEQDSIFLYRGGFALYSIATAVVINAALQPGIVERVLSLRPLVWVGVVSYGAYIYHWPIYLALDSSRTGLVGAPLLGLQIGATLVVAAASYFLLERPIRSGRWLLGARFLVATPATAGVVVAALLMVTNRPLEPDRPFPGYGQPQPMPALGPPAPVGPLRVAVFGDSIGWNIGSGLEKWAVRNARMATVWNLASYGCGLGRGSERSDIAVEQNQRRCSTWPEWWEVDIERFHPDVILILFGIWDLAQRQVPHTDRVSAPGDPVFDDWLLSEYQLAVDIASSRGARVVWLTSPCVGPATGQHSSLGVAGALDPSRLEHLNRVLLPRLVASRPHQVVLFDLFAQVCPDGTFVESLPWARDLRSDSLHIGREAASLLGEPIMQTAWPGLDQTRAALAAARASAAAPQ